MTRKLLLAACAALMLSGPALAASNTQNRGSYDPQSDSTRTSSKPACSASLGRQLGLAVTSATTLTVPSGATIAYITVEGQGIRWRNDGTSPTASVGFPVPAGAQFVYVESPLSSLSIIQQAASATLDVEYC